MTLRSFILLAVYTLALAGCKTSPVTSQPAQIPATAAVLTPTERPTATPIPQTEVPSASATSEPQAPIRHRIGVRTVDGMGEFYDRLTGEKFIPRGFNYIRLAPMGGPGSGLWHSTLNPGFYEPERAGLALQAMGEDGYNVVRIFIDCCRPGSNAGDPQGGVSQPYLENVIDFLERAKANRVYVLMVMDLTPAQGGYDEMWSQCCTLFDGENLRYLTPGGHTGERRFNQDFIRALIEANAPVDAIFAYDLTNEVHFSVNAPPFSLTSGKVTTANGTTYDIADPGDKQRMMEENLVYWIDRQRAAILEVDPTALVTVSFPAINLGETTIDPAPAIFESTADFVDLHAYLGWGVSFTQYMGRFGVAEPTEKPLILGEFGADRRGFADAAAAAGALLDLQVESCRYGFDGWLLWTWDGDEQEDLWNGMSEDGVISRELSPIVRPDPCDPGVEVSRKR